MLLLRALTRLVGALLMVALALLGLGIALYCLDGLLTLGSVRPDRLLQLPTVRRQVNHFLEQIAAPGSTAWLALLCGLGAIVIGVLLLLGLLRSSKRRLAILESDNATGTIAARPGPLRAMARTLAARAPGATNVRKPRLALSRPGDRGRLRISASRARTSNPHAVESAISEHVQPLSEPFRLRTRVRVRVGERGERVQ